MSFKKLNIAERRRQININLYIKPTTKDTLLHAYDEMDSILLDVLIEIRNANKRKHRLVFYKKKV